MKKISILSDDVISYFLSLYLLKNNDVDITFVELNTSSNQIDFSTKNITQLINELDLNPYELIKETESAFKISNAYRQENENDEYIKHNIDFLDSLITNDKLVLDLKKYIKFSKNKHKKLLSRYQYPILNLCDLNLFNENIFDYSIYENTSYQFNIKLLIDFLKSKLNAFDNFKLIKSDDVKLVRSDGNSIEYMMVDDLKIKSDLYIDCSNESKKNSDILEKFVSLSHVFKTNTLISAKVNYENTYRELIPFTKSTGVSNGWIYNVSTFNYNNIQYTYQDDLNPIDFEKYISKYDVLDLSETRYKSEFYQNIWQNNLLLFGKNYCYLESIEGNEMLMFNFIKHISKLLNEEYITEFKKYKFNEYYVDCVEKYISKIIKDRYFDLTRNDSNFWKQFNTHEYYQYTKVYNNEDDYEMFLDESFKNLNISYIYKLVNEVIDKRKTLSFNLVNYYQWLKNNIFEKE